MFAFQGNDLEIISVDIDKSGKFKGTALIDTSYFEIVPLETGEQSLISSVSKIWLKGEKIIVYDENQSGAFVFNRDGSFHAKVHAIGQGPGEYPPFVNDMAVTENYIIVFPPETGMLYLYDFDGKFVRNISLEGTWGYTLFSFDERNYHFINGGSSSKAGLFKFFTLDSHTKKVNAFLPFKESEVNHIWMLQNYYSKSPDQDKALIIYCTNDTIYEFTPPDKLIPRYYLDITRKKLPRHLFEVDARTALMQVINNGYVTIKAVQEYSRFLTLYLSPDHVLFYDKQTKEVNITDKMLSIPPWSLNFTLQHKSLADNDTILMNCDANMFLFTNKETHFQDVSSPTFRKRMLEIVEVLEDDSNPVVIITKMRENPQFIND